MRIAVIPGDGIGAEVTPQAVKVLKAVTAPARRPLEFVEFDKFQRPPGGSSHGFQHLHGLRSNLRPNAVAGNHGDSHRGTATSQRNARQSLASSTAGFAPAANYVIWND